MFKKVFLYGLFALNGVSAIWASKSAESTLSDRERTELRQNPVVFGTKVTLESIMWETLLNKAGIAHITPDTVDQYFAKNNLQENEANFERFVTYLIEKNRSMLSLVQSSYSENVEVSQLQRLNAFYGNFRRALVETVNACGKNVVFPENWAQDSEPRKVVQNISENIKEINETIKIYCNQITKLDDLYVLRDVFLQQTANIRLG